MSTSKNSCQHPLVSIADLAAMQTRAHDVVNENRAAAAAPSVKKVPPEFNSSQVADLCGIDRNKLEHRRRKGGLPDGREEARRRLFTLKEAQKWVLDLATEPQAWMRAQRRDAKSSRIDCRKLQGWGQEKYDCSDSCTGA